MVLLLGLFERLAELHLLSIEGRIVKYHRVKIHPSAQSAEFIKAMDADVSIDVRPIRMSSPVILLRRRRKMLLLVMLVCMGWLMM